MKISRPVAFAAGALMALVLGSGTAVAATGGKFILGKTNTAAATTVLKNSKGTAIQFTSKPGTPSFKVSNSTKVPGLNADLLDGSDSSAFALTSGQTNTVLGLTFPLDVDDDGLDDLLVSIATCPAGTKLTGGGGDDYTNDGSLFANSPVDRQSWFVSSTTTDLSATDDVVSYAVCYNPRGGVPGGTFRREAPAKPGASAREVVKERLAKKVD
ncbi:hypothetical protein ACIRN4_14155 [Pimelobacter simplex]|uniref:hypothetical protein n=1 Tax=Nocardioides simplex TaxID=2045 RepID=UPI003802C057